MRGPLNLLSTRKWMGYFSSPWFFTIGLIKEKFYTIKPLGSNYKIIKAL